MKYGLLVLVWFLLCTSAQAELTRADTALLKMVMAQASIPTKACYCDLAAVKTMPNQPTRAIVVVPEINEIGDGGDWFDLHSHVFVVNKVDGGILHRYFESSKTNGWTSDAVRITDITIDTARYYLSKTTRAFGVRVKYLGSSRPNPYSQETLTLFTLSKKNKLKPVLKSLDVYSYGGEFDGDCEGEFYSTRTTLDMTREKTQGFYDIILNHQNKTEVSTYNESKECDSTLQQSQQTERLQYNAQRGYHLQKTLKNKTNNSLKSE